MFGITLVASCTGPDAFPTCMAEAKGCNERVIPLRSRTSSISCVSGTAPREAEGDRCILFFGKEEIGNACAEQFIERKTIDFS